jgi:hypothetical protein
MLGLMARDLVMPPVADRGRESGNAGGLLRSQQVTRMQTAMSGRRHAKATPAAS